MEVSNIRKALRTHRMESKKIDFTDLSTFDIVPTPPKEPKPEVNKLNRRHGVRVQKSKTYETNDSPSQEPETRKSTTRPKHDTTNVSCDLPRTGEKDIPWYCQNPKTKDTPFEKEENAIHRKSTYNDVKFTLTDQKTNPSPGAEVNTNPIRYPTPGPREQLSPSPFPVNKNKLAPVVNPRRNAVPRTVRVVPRSVKPKRMPVCDPSVNVTVIDRPARVSQSLPESLNNPNPIRYPTPGPRDPLTPSPFPVNKNKLAPVVDPKRNAVPRTARVGPRPVKAVHMPIYNDNSESSCILTQLYGDRGDYVADSVVPVMKNSRPIRYPPPGPREQLLPNPFPVNKARLPPLIKHGRVVAPMCG
ncbi:extensin-like [Pecten maximus]|uniref:extensin-like n=1 Tax=Pecten maximus TaxID=6579 RepID=UPI0014587439|nr:extensin-like [Pecten maximus]